MTLPLLRQVVLTHMSININSNGNVQVRITRPAVPVLGILLCQANCSTRVPYHWSTITVNDLLTLPFLNSWLDFWLICLVLFREICSQTYAGLHQEQCRFALPKGKVQVAQSFPSCPLQRGNAHTATPFSMLCQPVCRGNWLPWTGFLPITFHSFGVTCAYESNPGTPLSTTASVGALIPRLCVLSFPSCARGSHTLAFRL